MNYWILYAQLGSIPILTLTFLILGETRRPLKKKLLTAQMLFLAAQVVCLIVGMQR